MVNPNIRASMCIRRVYLCVYTRPARYFTHSSVVQIKSQQPSAMGLTAESGVGLAVCYVCVAGGGMDMGVDMEGGWAG